MAILAEIMGHLRQFNVSGCHVRGRNLISFSCQKWIVDDSLEPRQTMIFFYYPDDPKADQWAASQLDDVTGIHGCACFKPEERWVFVSDPGEVYVVGQGEDNYEKPIDTSTLKLFSTVKCIGKGYAYAVGLSRDVYKRIAANNWVKLTDKFLSSDLPEALDNAGFDDIDGFSENDIYACGGHGDLWHYNGKIWTKEGVPTNSNLEKICCASNGLVYITTNRQELLIGKKSLWRIIRQGVSENIFEEIVEFDSRVLVSTEDAIFEVHDEKLIETQLSIPKMNSYAHLASGDGILVVAGANEAFMYDGNKWTEIFKFD